MRPQTQPTQQTTNWDLWVWYAGTLFLSGSVVLWNDEAGYSTYALLRYVVLWMTITLYITQWRKLRWPHPTVIPLVMLCAWAVLSSLWSLDPATTFRRSFALVAAFLHGLYLGQRLPLPDALHWIRRVLLTLVLASLVALVLLPNQAVMGEPHPGAWRGVLSHKNTFGRVLLLLLVFLLVDVRSRVEGLLLLASFVAIVFTRSATTQVLGLLLLCSRPFWTLIALRPAWLIASTLWTGFFALLGAWWFAFHYSTVFALFGRDPTLTGRTHLWQAAWRTIEQHLLIGQGYDVAFAPGATIYRYLIWRSAPHAHNGWLDTWLELGLVGVLLWSIVLLLGLWSYIARYRVQRERAFLVGILFFVMIALSSLTETSPITLRNHLFVFLVVFVGARMSGGSARPIVGSHAPEN